MTDSEYIEDAPQEYLGASEPLEPIAIVDVSERHPPELCSTNTWTIPATTAGTPVQILQRTKKRFKAKITITVAGGATSLVFNPIIDRLQGTSPQGMSFPTTVTPYNIPDWERQQPLYVIAVGGGPAQVTVQDERYQ